MRILSKAGTPESAIWGSCYGSDGRVATRRLLHPEARRASVASGGSRPRRALRGQHDARAWAEDESPEYTAARYWAQRVRDPGETSWRPRDNLRVLRPTE